MATVRTVMTPDDDPMDVEILITAIKTRMLADTYQCANGKGWCGGMDVCGDDGICQQSKLDKEAYAAQVAAEKEIGEG